jgi:hypothetical protein
MQMPWARLGFDLDEAEAIASKLQSFGLLSGSRSLSAVQNTYIVLQRARDFVDYIRSAVPQHDCCSDIPTPLSAPPESVS